MLKLLSNRILERMRTRFNYLYGSADQRCVERMVMTVGRYGVGINGYKPQPLWDQTDSVLITYGDMVRGDNRKPLESLHGFLRKHVKDAVRTVHVLPFFPYSSDDGFSIKDYREVDPELGAWRDIQRLSRDYKLMVDMVINHVSRQSSWFRDYVNYISPYRHYFIETDINTDLSSVVRPRSTPLLSPVRTRKGERRVWTTFSPDQVDLNFANPDVLFEFIDILLWYIAMGARVIRLDAIAYLWKQAGTPCIHLTQTHEVVKIFRDILDMIAPHVVLITETNVPHDENISYFGNGDEAHMVYQFSLPPLLAHALLTGNSTYLTHWAGALPDLAPGNTFLNFTASHDGIGVRPLHGLIPDDEFESFISNAPEMGGRISYKSNPDGTESPYELNITYFDMLADRVDVVTDSHISRYLCSQTVMLGLKGIPAVYFNSLIGARNNMKGMEETGHNRTINREKWTNEQLASMLNDKASHHKTIFDFYIHALRIRAMHKAFHPDGLQRVISIKDNVFAFERIAPDNSECVTCISNIANAESEIAVDERLPSLNSSDNWKDLLSGVKLGEFDRMIRLDPYQTVWLNNSQ